MKKYSIFDTVGNLISVVGIFAFIFCMCADLDSTAIRDLFNLGVMFVISGAIIALGQLIAHVDIVEGIVLSALIVVGAWICNILSKSKKAFKTCHEIKSQYGTYKNTYKKCRQRYSEYVDWLYEREAEKNEEVRYEQSKQTAASSSGMYCR